MKNLSVLEHITEWLLVSILFLLPLQTRWIIHQGMIDGKPWEYGTISFYAVDVLIAFFLFFATAVIVRDRRVVLSLPLVIALFFGVVAFFSMVFAGDRGATLFGFVKLIEGIAMFTVTLHLNIRPRRIVAVLISSAVVQSGFALVQFMTQSISASTWLGMAAQNPAVAGVSVIENAGGRFLRAYGTFPHPNMLGGFLSVGLLFAIIQYCQMPPRWMRLLVAIAISLVSIGLWLSFSRQALLATGIVLAIIITMTFIRTSFFPKKLFMSVLLALLPLITFSALFPELISTRLSQNSRLEIQSLSIRQSLQAETLTLIKTSWPMGVGINNITAKMYERDQQTNRHRDASSYQPVHNIYLLILTELGIFGLLIFGFFIANVSTRIFSSELHNNILPFTAAFSALLIIGFLDHYLWTLHSGILLFWILAGLTLREHNIDEHIAF